jgi:uncharacterized protein (DUF2236 family)
MPITATDDDGYFPPTSVLRRVHQERAVGLLYGQRALMIGALNPIAFIGTNQSSKAGERPWKRLTHTAELFEAVFFGTRSQADKALAFTERLHKRVRGRIPRAVGPYRAGTRYSAFDPELMMWVVAPMYDSARTLYELLVRSLSEDEREQLWDEYLLFGELFGMPRATAPGSAKDLEVWWDEQFASKRIFLTEAARAVGRSIATKLPLPLYARLPMRAGAFVLVGSLPRPVRDQYRFEWSSRDEVAFRALTAAHRAGRPLMPKVLRRGSCLPFYATIARQERRQVRAGRTGFAAAAVPLPPLPP